MHLSQKQKNFSKFFCSFLKCAVNLEHFQINMTLIAYGSPTLWTAKNMGRSMSKMSRFKGLLDRQHGKRAETLFQSQRQHLRHIS